ncbi:MAG: right-handed parallel beta-helix repeat-containing protein [Planctomycetota bacterium]
MTRSALFAICLLVGLCSAALSQTTWHVDASNPGCPGSGSPADPFCKIQDAIQAASSGDTVLVAAGLYFENIDYLGKDLVVRSLDGPQATIIDGSQAAPTVSFQSGEGTGAVIEGFRITRGYGLYAGGVLCSNGAAPVIRGNIISNNAAPSGGGVSCLSSAPTLINNTITLNSSSDGAGVYALYASPTLIGNLIHRNSASFRGGGILMRGSTPVITQDILTYNSALYGAALQSDNNSIVTLTNVTATLNDAMFGSVIDAASGSLTIANSIVFKNTRYSIASSALTNVTYSDIEGGYPGLGNLNIDPQLRNPNNGDTRLKCGSPMIDAGNNAPGIALPTFDQERRDRRLIGTIDIGADEYGLEWLLNGTGQVGQPASFLSSAAPSQNGQLAEVYLSLNGTGSIPVPGGGGRVLELGFTGLLSLWLGLPPVIRQVSLNGCSGASTPSVTIPPGAPVGLQVHYAGVSWNLGTGQVISVAETRFFTTQ